MDNNLVSWRLALYRHDSAFHRPLNTDVITAVCMRKSRDAGEAGLHIAFGDIRFCQGFSGSAFFAGVIITA